MTIHVGASDPAVMTYNDKSITFTGDLADYDYDAILRDKQRNIVRLYELADYFVDADPIFRGIIKGVYTPFALHTPYRLVGTTGTNWSGDNGAIKVCNKSAYSVNIIVGGTFPTSRQIDWIAVGI